MMRLALPKLKLRNPMNLFGRTSSETSRQTEQETVMVVPDDPLGIQGVTDAGGDSGDTAPVSTDLAPDSEPSLGGEPAHADEDGRGKDRPDKNYVKELLRKQAKLEDRLESMQIELAAQALAAERSNGPQEPEKPPYTDSECDAFLADGDMKRWAEATRANLRWETQQEARSTAVQQSQAQRAQSVDRHIKKIIHVDEDSEFGQAVAKRARELRDEYPGFAREFYPLLAKAELAGDNSSVAEDLRGESLSRSAAAAAGVPAASGVPVEMKVNFDSPNRGLPANVVEKLRNHNLGDLLIKGANAEQEARRRESLQRFLARNTEIQKGRVRR
jgi:hypothetical protein